MKYLKQFNESTDDNFKEELKDFCEMNLAYLLDDDVEIQVIESDEFTGHNLIRIGLIDDPKSWSEIKDQMIPFLTRLDNKYDIRRNSSTGLIRFFLEDDPYSLWSVSLQEISAFKNVKEEKVKNLIADEPNLWFNSIAKRSKINEMRLYVEGYKIKKIYT